MHITSHCKRSRQIQVCQKVLLVVVKVQVKNFQYFCLYLFCFACLFFSETGITASLAPPPVDENLAIRERLEQVQACLKRSNQTDGTIITYNFIALYKTLLLACGLSIEGNFEDPKVRETLILK